MFLQKTYELVDAIWTNPLTSDSNAITFANDVNYSFSSDGLTMNSSSVKYSYFNGTVPKNIVVTGKLKFTSTSTGPFISIHNANCVRGYATSLYIEDRATGFTKRTQVSFTTQADKWYSFKVEYDDEDIIKLYIDDTLIITKSITPSQYKLYFSCGMQKITIKDILVKAL